MMNLYELKRKPVWQMNGEELLELQRLAAPQRVESAEVKEPRLVYVVFNVFADSFEQIHSFAN